MADWDNKDVNLVAAAVVRQPASPYGPTSTPGSQAVAIRALGALVESGRWVRRSVLAEEIAAALDVLAEDARKEIRWSAGASGSLAVAGAYSHAAGVARLLSVPDCGDEYHGADGGACAGCGFDAAAVVGQERTEEQAHG